MGPIDEFELDILDHTGDLDLAQEVGTIVRDLVAQTAENFAIIMGVPAEALRADVERCLLDCPIFTVENAVTEDDSDA
ncbi:hypothetical protein KL864_27050 [Mycolicibacterium goodii]|uniref:hypothetical protein n=1 Tax=Mycolicibacterium goodii TaxID=134601 RepID=UPI001BDC2C4B|nr:hypothetical protein [Mycolicibacterium goodii]MBU8819548.1 hypothetical protein [Mycolicibacterium goodii]